MITHCQECDTYFRVSIEQLKASQGNVKCGCCMTVFNAIESLLESSDPQSSSTTTDQVSGKTTGSLGSALLGPEKAEASLKIDSEPDVPFVDADTHFVSDDNDLAEQVEVELIETDFVPGEKSETTAGEKRVVEEGEHPFIEELDEDISYDQISEPRKRSGAIWFFASLLMLGTLGFQLIKFNPEITLTKFPQLQFICPYIECPVEKKINDTSQINLISRDVREHPQFQNVLLVNATLMSSAKDRVPFPKLQLDLFDKMGRPIGSRQFLPNEYLDSSVDLNIGMKPELPVHIVLEVMGTGEETRSFEFNFL